MNYNEALTEVILAIENNCTIANGKEVAKIMKSIKDTFKPQAPYICKEEWGNQICCPTCDCYVYPDRDIQYCANCGQALDWSGND